MTTVTFVGKDMNDQIAHWFVLDGFDDLSGLCFYNETYGIIDNFSVIDDEGNCIDNLNVASIVRRLCSDADKFPLDTVH